MSFRRAGVAVLAALLLSTLVAPGAVFAQTVAVLRGVVLDASGHPVPSASVTVSGQNVTLGTTSDAQGRFAFPTLSVGSYTISVQKETLRTSQSVDVGSSGASVSLRLEPTQTIGRINVPAGPNLATQSGTNFVINGAQLQQLAVSQSLPDLLTQLPSAARGSNGQIHINGDHNGLNFYLDGVQLPANLNRVLGNIVDPTDIGFLDVVEGAYPAQYGDRFASVLNIGSKANTGPAGFGIDALAGSYGTVDGTLSGHVPIGAGGSLTLAGREQRTNYALDPPVPDAPNNSGSISNQFLRLTLPFHGTDFLNLDVLNSLQTFQIPPDLANGISANTNDNEIQSDFFASLQYRHAIGDHGSVSFGPSFKFGRILDNNDPTNDLAPAAGTSCVDFSDPSCFYSVFADRSERDYRFNLDYANQSPHHDVRFGFLYDATTVLKNYLITVQAENQLNPNGGPFTAVDTSPNVAHQQQVYLQDSWTMGRYRLDYGLRGDSFQIFSTDFQSGFSQVSPRIKLTRSFGPRASVYVYYGRLFEPFSFENISPTTAASLFVAANSPGVTFDLKPERDSLYEAGFHLPLGRGDLGFRVSSRVATDYIDDTQVGATNLHQDINFPQGRVSLQSISYQQPLPRNGKFYLSLTHSLAVNSAFCETQLLQNCAAGGQTPGGDFRQSDHDQRVDANAGIILNDRSGGWFSFNTEYGSGLSQDPSLCSTNDAVNCKVPPHIVVDAEKGFAIGAHETLSISALNLLNEKYAITLNSSLQGTHYARPRTLFIQLRSNR